MPTIAPPPPSSDPGRGARLAAGAAAFALAELAAGLLLGRFLEWGRAEAMLFLAFRPATLFVAAVAAARMRWQDRAVLYAGGLAIAAAAETALVLQLGNPDPWPEMLRGLAAGAALALVADLLVQAGLRWGGRHGRWVSVPVFVLLLAVPGALRPYEALLEPRAAPTAVKPKLLLMTGLPIVWGEAGPFDPSSRPAAAYRLLQEEFDVELVDTLEAGTLRGSRLLLLAQPHRLEPAELAGLDAWVRGGGRVLILLDANLSWPSELPLGDIRRPPPVTLLGPVLGHWGLIVEEGEATRRVERVGGRKLVLQSPGRLISDGPACNVERNGYLAHCALGQGRATLVADADLIHDALWAPLGPERARRTADNGLVVADWLDSLAGSPRERRGGRVAWTAPDAEARRAATVVAVALALLLFGALWTRRWKRTTNLSTGANNANESGT